MKRNWMLLFCLLSGILAACQGSGVGPVGTATPPAQITPATPLPGKATVVGRATALFTGKPFASIAVRLAVVLHLPPNSDTFMLDDAHSPGAISDTQGYFVITDVAPNDYVVIIGNPNVQYAVPTAEPDKARVWKLSAGQITDFGELRVVLH
jgi:hypothetical protein